MALRIRALQLRIETPEGRYGTEIVFDNGLCVIRAPNTSGKSTCLQAIVYALGLEGMLSASHDVPLPQAVTDLLDDGTAHTVLESSVLIEIENHENLRLTVERPIKSTRDRRLVTVWDGPALTESSRSYHQRDYFVRVSGSATSRAGFHTKLAEFLGWDLPAVARYDGGEAPLYLECIFPLLFVEQKKGWTVLPARFPQYLGIRDIGKRAVEFLLDLDASRIYLMRQQLKEERNAIKALWTTYLDQLADVADSVSAVLQNVPAEPTASWPPSVAPTLWVAVGDDWEPFRASLVRQRERLEELTTESLPPITEVATQIEAELEEVRNALAQHEFLLQRSFDDLQMEQQQSQSIDQRLGALNEDLRQYQDTRRLQGFGSQHSVQVADSVCPTCHQSLADSLLPQDGLQQVMTVDENIEFIRAQVDVFEAAKRENERVIDMRAAQAEALRGDVARLRERVRQLRVTLVSDARLPSLAVLQQRIALEQQIRMSERAVERFDTLLVRLGEAAERWRDVSARLAALPEGNLSPGDTAKLEAFQTSFVDQLSEYGLTSTSPRDLRVSHDNYYYCVIN